MMLGTEHVGVDEAPTASTSITSSEERSPLAKIAAKLLYKRMRIKVTDGRVLVGDFICLDKQGNVILNSTVERYEVNGQPEEKMLGQVLIPAAQRQSCNIEVVAQEKAAVEALVTAAAESSAPRPI